MTKNIPQMAYKQYFPDHTGNTTLVERILYDSEIVKIDPTPHCEVRCPQCQGDRAGLSYWQGKRSWNCQNCLNIKKISKKILIVPMPKGIPEELTYACHSQCNPQVSNPQEVLDEMKSMAKDPKGFLLLSGENGVGKSYAAVACVRAFLRLQNKEFGGGERFWNISDLYIEWLKEIKEIGHPARLVEQMKGAHLLVFDDLGNRTAGDAFLDFIYLCINGRRGGTIVTTNLTQKQMHERFGGAITSRLSAGKCFKFQGEDRRKDKY